MSGQVQILASMLWPHSIMLNLIFTVHYQLLCISSSVTSFRSSSETFLFSKIISSVPLPSDKFVCVCVYACIYGWVCMHAYTRARTHTHMHAHTHVRWGNMHGCEKDSSEVGIVEVHPESGLERGGRSRVAECLRQTVPNRWASVRKWSSPNVFVSTWGVTKHEIVASLQNWWPWTGPV